MQRKVKMKQLLQNKRFKIFNYLIRITVWCSQHKQTVYWT